MGRTLEQAQVRKVTEKTRMRCNTKKSNLATGKDPDTWGREILTVTCIRFFAPYLGHKVCVWFCFVSVVRLELVLLRYNPLTNKQTNNKRLP